MPEDQNILYLIKDEETDWEVVTKGEWVSAERKAGFQNTLGKPHEPATSGFSDNGFRGVIVYTEHFLPGQYEDDPELRRAIVKALKEHRMASTPS